MLEKNGIIVVASFVAPFRESRLFVRDQAKRFVEVYLKTTVVNCELRDKQGRYAKARAGEYQFFPGPMWNMKSHWMRKLLLMSTKLLSMRPPIKL
jgi:adenylylsulfate kinase-like enzyme